MSTSWGISRQLPPILMGVVMYEYHVKSNTGKTTYGVHTDIEKAREHLYVFNCRAHIQYVEVKHEEVI